MVDDANGEKKSILGKKGKVYGIDVHPELVKLARENIMKEDSDLLRNNVVELSVGDGWKGLPEKGPFDVIHVGAAADTFPKNLMMQLQLKGALIVPVGPDGGDQALYKVERVTESDIYNAKDFKKQRQLGVRYVPLIHPKN